MTVVSGTLARSRALTVAMIDAEVRGHEDDRRAVCALVLRPFAEAYWRIDHADLSGLNPLDTAAILRARSVDLKPVRDMCGDLVQAESHAAADAVMRRSWQVRRVLHRLVQVTRPRVVALEGLVGRGADYRTFGGRDRAHLAVTAGLVRSAVTIMGTPVMGPDGAVTGQSEQAVADVTRHLDALATH